MKYKLGILGGMGPSATVDLYKRITDYTSAKCDQDHIKMVILSNCDTPDRTKALTSGGESPLAALNAGIDTLISLGCEYFIIPCNTAHAYSKEFKNLDKIKFISMIDEVKDKLKNEFKNKKVCILCTNGTKQAKVYDDKDIDINYPHHQDDVMKVVTNTKAGLDELSLLQSIIKEEEKNYDVFLLACTELSLYKDKLVTKKVIIDAMDVLVKRTILLCGKEYV